MIVVIRHIVTNTNPTASSVPPERVMRQARAWQRWGLGAGDAVAVLVPVSIELAEILLSLLAAGMTAVLADPAGNIASLVESFRKARIRALAGIRRAQLLRAVSPFLRRLPLKVVCGRALPGEKSWASASAEAPLEAPREWPEEQPALLTFTTGSSGTPKAVGRTVGFLMIQQDILRRELGLEFYL